MKTIFNKILLRLGSLFVFSALLAKADDTNLMFDVGPEPHDFFWGDSTNAIRGGIFPRSIISETAEVVVYAQRTGEALHVVFPRTNFYSDIYMYTPTYLGATNLFCGPIMMQDAAGQILPLLKPEVSSAEPYPDELSWHNLENIMYLEHERRVFGSKGLAFLCGTNPEQMNRFNISNYYQIENPGAYTLTIWPKVYERDETNKDVYRRIDLPPVSVTMKWRNGVSPHD